MNATRVIIQHARWPQRSQLLQGVPAHIDIPDHPLTWLLDRTASHYPGRTVLIYYGTRLSYAQFAHHAHRFALALQNLGVHKGDRVAIALPNIPQYPMAFYGVELRKT